MSPGGSFFDVCSYGAGGCLSVSFCIPCLRSARNERVDPYIRVWGLGVRGPYMIPNNIVVAIFFSIPSFPTDQWEVT